MIADCPQKNIQKTCASKLHKLLLCNKHKKMSISFRTLWKYSMAIWNVWLFLWFFDASRSTDSPRMPSDPSKLSREQANAVLKAHGLRRTFTRVSVLQSIAQYSAPVTHAEMSERLMGQGFDSSTIFRALNDLVDAGILVRLDVGDHAWRFEIRNQSGSRSVPGSPHPHVVCRECGRIQCIEWQKEVKNLELHLAGWEIDEAIFRGFCNHCRRP